MTLTPDPQSPLQGFGSLRPGAVSPNDATSKATPDRASGAVDESGAAFRALLERLEERTRELEEQSQSVKDASGLAGAVDTARASLEEAVSLSDQLLEAYREARQQSALQTNDTTSGTTEKPT